MSTYEGKNIFRTVLSQKPVFSGNSNIVASRFDVGYLFAKNKQQQQQDDNDQEQSNNNNNNKSTLIDVTTFAFGSTLNIVNRQTGTTMISREVGLEDDVILNIDAIAVPQDKQNNNNDNNEDSLAAQDAAAAADGAAPKPVLYVACSTRSLQIYVFALYAATLKDAKKKIKKNARMKNPLADRSAVDEAFAKTKLVEDDPLGVTYALSLVKNWTADQTAVSCLKFSPKTLHLASGSADGGLKVWNVLNHYLTHSFRGQNSGVVTSLAFLEEDESLLAAGTFEGYITVIDFSSKKVIATARPHSSSVEALSLTARSEKEKGTVLLISASRDRNVSVFEAKSLKILRSVALGNPLLACSFSSPFVGIYGCENGLLGAFAVSPQTFGVVVFATRAAPTHGVEEEHCVRGITFLKKDAAAVPSAIARHSLLNETVLVVDASYRLFTFNATFSAAETTSCTLDRPFKAEFNCERTDILNFDQIMDIKFFPITNNKNAILPTKRRNELVIATNARDAYVTRSVGSSQLRGTLQGHSDIIVAIDINGDGTQIITASKDMSARIWDSDSLACIATTSTATKIHSQELTSVKFIPSSNPAEISLVCTLSLDAVLATWDLNAIAKNMNKDSGVIAQLPHTASVASCHDGSAFCLAVSPNGQYLATGGKDKSVRLWVMRGKRMFSEGAMRGHRRTVSAVAFSPVDKIVVSGSNDGALRVWSLVSLTCVKTLQMDSVPILQLSFFNKGTQVVAMNSEGISRFWAVAAGECVAVTNPHNERSWALALREEEVPVENMRQLQKQGRRIEMLFDEDNKPVVEKAENEGEAEAEAEEEEEEENDEAEQDEARNERQKTYLRTILVSGGADGSLVCQEDFTDQRIEEMRIEREDTTKKEQQLRNTMREGDFKDAFLLALSLNHPRHLRQVLSTWMGKTNTARTQQEQKSLASSASEGKESGKRRQRGNDDNEEEEEQSQKEFAKNLLSSSVSKEEEGVAKQQQQQEEEDECERDVADIISSLSNNDLFRLFGFARIWLTNAKHCGPASLVVAASLKALHPEKLEKMSAFSEVAESLQAYSKRHLTRLRRTQDHLFYVEFLTKGQMTGQN